MKPYRISGIAVVMLLFFVVAYIGTASINSFEGIHIEDIALSFIFPTFLFFLFWIVSFNFKKYELKISKYYLKVFLNIIIPYIICIIPYVIYKYGINNLVFSDFAEMLINGDISVCFKYVKTIMHLFLIYPLVNFLFKKKEKVFVIISLVLNIISVFFNLEQYINTNVLNYLIYMVMGMIFTYHEKDIALFFKSDMQVLLIHFTEAVLLTVVTAYFEAYRFLNPVALIYYSIMIAIIMSSFCYKYRTFFGRKPSYIHEFNIFNPPIIAISIFLLVEIFIEIVKVPIVYLIQTTPSLAFGLILVITIIITISLKRIFKKNKNLYQKG